MFVFCLQKSYSSDEMLIRFESSADNQGFRDALKQIMEPHGFICDYDDYHISIYKPNGDKKLQKLTISSDQWFVWGDSNTWGNDFRLNQESMNWLKDELLKSGLFMQSESS